MRRSIGAVFGAAVILFATVADAHGRIVGGAPADISDFPWQVALVHADQQDPVRDQYCGGTLILPDVVVTAAHCVDDKSILRNATKVDVVAGTALYGIGGERIRVASIAVDPGWNPATGDDDVAVLRLSSPSRLGTPIPLQSTPVAVGSKVTVSGWGALGEGAAGSAILMSATIHIVANTTCRYAPEYAARVTPNMVCAGEAMGGVDACQGDSGGPLVVGSGQAARLVGIVSWGDGCALQGRYGVYTRISAVADWVESVVSPSNVLVAANPQVGPRTAWLRAVWSDFRG